MYASFDSTATQPTPVTGWYDDMTPACKLVPAANLLQLTQAQWDNRLNTPYVQNGALVAAPAPTSAQISAQAWSAYQAGAKGALLATDTTVARISEAISLGATTATTADVVAFMQYRKDLRAILTQAQPKTIPTSLPTKPPYPANT
ncbi:hypothetical protein [Sideroxydans lithotrophicus]|uniref:Uncharacterized protein n=1 Tax=Sideroxydans lithotrophicus (strain ES-1) TaxID=580332 RepID=D5CT38_SIDLE|nr:hypothetical protein [Sideroxydans lithotrophicus]ADE12124.1 hypothetical protein Slit_1895 [Sideroxydans lithotrophicus ES-1]